MVVKDLTGLFKIALGETLRSSFSYKKDNYSNIPLCLVFTFHKSNLIMIFVLMIKELIKDLQDFACIFTCKEADVQVDSTCII